MSVLIGIHEGAYRPYPDLRGWVTIRHQHFNEGFRFTRSSSYYAGLLRPYLDFPEGHTGFSWFRRVTKPYRLNARTAIAVTAASRSLKDAA